MITNKNVNRSVRTMIKKDGFFKVNSNNQYTGAMFCNKNQWYLVDTKKFDSLDVFRGGVLETRIVQCITPKGGMFLLPISEPYPSPYLKDKLTWKNSLDIIVEKAQREWVHINSDRILKKYFLIEKKSFNDFQAVAWPDVDFNTIIDRAFPSARIIDSWDHTVVKSLMY